MFKVNDYVVYGLTGVCQIIDIEREHLNNEENEYYVLKPTFSDNMIIKIPVNNSKVMMRKTMSKEETLALIEMMPEQDPVWFNDNRERNEYFKAALRTGKSEEWAKLVKTLYLAKQEKLAAGRRLSKTDEDIFKTAEKQLYEEIAVALGIPLDEVVPFIFQHIPKEI